MRREEHCTHPEQEWCDCDWCRYLRAVADSYALARWTLAQQGRLSCALYPNSYTNPVTLKREFGYVVTPLRVEWD